MHYKYCPECGNKLIEKDAMDEGKVPYCSQCEKFWFDSFASCVIVLVANEAHEVALLKQAYLSNQYRNYVSGYILPGENAEECALREVKEELGIELKQLNYAGTYWFQAAGQLMHGFIGLTEKCKFVLSEEVNEAEWVSYENVKELIFPDTPGNAMHPLLKIYLEKYRE